MTGGGGERPRDPGTPCDRLQFDTALDSPIPEVVARLQVAEVLGLSLESAGRAVGARRRVAGTPLAGYITERLPELLRCLQQGNEFTAVVRSIKGGAVRVRIQPG